MDSLAAFRYLASQPDLLAVMERSRASEWHRLMVFGLALQEAGFACEIRTKDINFTAPGKARIASTVSALFLPLENDMTQCVAGDGTEGEEEVLRRHLESAARGAGVSEFTLLSSTDWNFTIPVDADNFSKTFPATYKDENYLELARLATSAMQALNLDRTTHPVDRPGLRPRI